MNIFDPLNIAVIIILVYSAILHEIAHGLMAERLGDPTARLMGRITLDIRRHIDPYMTIILPLLMIVSNFPVVLGGAKPVPVDPFNLRDGRKDLALVSLAGPLTNLGIALIVSVLLHVFFPQGSSTVVYLLLLITAKMNVGLAIFNLLPIPPLDGSKVFSLLLPSHMANQYLSLGNVGPLLLIVLLWFPIGGVSIFDIIRTLSCSVFTLLQLPC
ncbi:site-2 protease family protein [soil metagenome]